MSHLLKFQQDILADLRPEVKKSKGELVMAKNFTPHRIAFYVGIIAVWQLVALSGVWPENIFPSPI